jgi:2-dehydropantoate 2-reductase
VAHTGSGPTFIGPYPGASASMTDVAISAMRAAAIDVTARTDIETVIWQKLILNAATLPTSALTGLRMGPLGEPPLIGLLDAIAREAIAVARAAGHPIDVEERLETIHRIVAGATAGKASMLQDVEAGRRTEIDVITGAVIRMAEQFGVNVPVNRALFALVKGVERARELN